MVEVVVVPCFWGFVPMGWAPLCWSGQVIAGMEDMVVKNVKNTIRTLFLSVSS